MAETDDKPDAKFVGLWEATWRRGYSTEERKGNVEEGTARPEHRT